MIPVVSQLAKVSVEIPLALRHLNCLSYGDVDGRERLTTTLLSCLGLLPSQRRVFISYRRNESRNVAVQLFEELSARCFDVFIDTHDIAPAENFQNMLWQKLCESDLLVMLDTEAYFDSRWSAAEFGRALAKNIGIFRLGWPDVVRSKMTDTISGNIDLSNCDFVGSGRLAKNTLSDVLKQLETARSKGLAIRSRNMISNLQDQIQRSGGRFEGIDGNNMVQARLHNEKKVALSAVLGVPTSLTAHNAFNANNTNRALAMIYDHVGLDKRYLAHIDWLAKNIADVRWIKIREADWVFADWEDVS